MAKYGPRPKPPEERFWKHVTPGEPDECWEWQGACSNGYGFLSGVPPRKWVKAHRVSWKIHNGPIPEGRHVLHTCDNPPCVNPAHLYVGTNADNVHDRAVRKRGREHRTENRGEDHPMSKFTEAEVRAIRAALRTGRTQAEVGRMFGVSQPNVSKIGLRQIWAHLDD